MSLGRRAFGFPGTNPLKSILKDLSRFTNTNWVMIILYMLYSAIIYIGDSHISLYYNITIHSGGLYHMGLYIRIITYIYNYKYICIYNYKYMYIYIYVYNYKYIYMCIYNYKYIFIYNYNYNIYVYI